MPATAFAPSAVNASPSRFIKLPELMARTALSRSSIYRRVKDDSTFPKPTTLGVRSVGWVEIEVENFVRSRIAERNSKESV